MLKRISKTFISFIIIMIFIVSLGINAGDEIRSIQEYTALQAEMMETILDTTIYDVNERVLFEAAMDGMFSALDDYSQFMTVEATDDFTNSIETEYVGVGIQLSNDGTNNVILKVFQGSPAEAAGVRAGDVIISVDGTDTEDWEIDPLLDILLGESGSFVDLGVRRGTQEIVFTIGRAQITIPTVEIYDIEDVADIDSDLAGQTAYIVVNSFGQNTHFDFSTYMQAALNEGAKYLILDLRSNSGGYTTPSIEMAKMLIPAGEVITFINSDGRETTYHSYIDESPFEEIITLTDEFTASSSEILASALQDSGASVLVGEKTFGKGISQYLYQVDPEYYIKITGQEFFSRNRNKIHGVGISPDYEMVVPDYIPGNYRLYEREDDEDVLVLEQILDYLGYEVGTIDTYYDNATTQAVYAFQADSGLHPYGIADYTTQAALNDALYASINADDKQLAKAIEVLEMLID